MRWLPRSMLLAVVRDTPSAAANASCDCGSSEQNAFLIDSAQSNQSSGVAATHLLFEGDDLCGYITLSTTTVRFERHEQPAGAVTASLPALLVAQLAVDRRATGRGLGGRLLQFANGIAQSLRFQIGCRYIAVDCSESLVPYYAKHGFRESVGEKRERKRRLDAQAGPGVPSFRLHRDLLAAQWEEAEHAPPHMAATEMHLAAATGDVAMLSSLLGARVPTNLPSGRGNDGLGWGATPLHWAAGKGQTAAMDLLIGAGADLYAVDGEVETPLHWATRFQQLNAVALLLRNKADPNIEGGRAVFTPLDYAVHHKDVAIAAVIRSSGGRHGEQIDPEINVPPSESE